MVGASGGKGVRPLREVWCEERSGEGKIQDAGAPNE